MFLKNVALFSMFKRNLKKTLHFVIMKTKAFARLVRVFKSIFGRLMPSSTPLTTLYLAVEV